MVQIAIERMCQYQFFLDQSRHLFMVVARAMRNIAAACLIALTANIIIASSTLADECNVANVSMVTQIKLNGQPFSAVPSHDGCTIFVSLSTNVQGGGAIAILSRKNGKINLVRQQPTARSLAGMSLSPSGRILAVTDGAGVELFDVEKLTRGESRALIASLQEGGAAGSVYVAFSPSGNLIAISDENIGSVSIYDVNYDGFSFNEKLVGRVRTGEAPVGLAFSPNGDLLYSTSELVRRGSECKGNEGSPRHGLGGIEIIDIAKAHAAPEDAIIAQMTAGCEPVRIVISADGATAYASARGDDALMVIDTAKALAKQSGAIKWVKVGKAPVGVAISRDDVFVANSNRFSDGRSQTISAINLADTTAAPRVIPAGGFPRELRVTDDEKTLLVTNFSTKALELVDLTRLRELN